MSSVKDSKTGETWPRRKCFTILPPGPSIAALHPSPGQAENLWAVSPVFLHRWKLLATLPWAKIHPESNIKAASWAPGPRLYEASRRALRPQTILDLLWHDCIWAHRKGDFCLTSAAWKAWASSTRGLCMRSGYTACEAQWARCCCSLGRGKGVKSTPCDPRQDPRDPQGCAGSGKDTTCDVQCRRKAGEGEPIFPKRVPDPPPSRDAWIPFRK